MISNVVLVYYIFSNEIKANRTFANWYVNNAGGFIVCVVFASFDMNSMYMITSGVFGLGMTSAEFSFDAKRNMAKYCNLSILIENIPQIILQVNIWRSIRSGTLHGGSVKESLLVSVINSGVDIFAASLGLCFSRVVHSGESYDYDHGLNLSRSATLSMSIFPEEERRTKPTLDATLLAKYSTAEHEYRTRALSLIDEEFQ